MKIYISVDMEGISGISHARYLMEKEAEYGRGRTLLMADLNAAVEGAVEAGATEILVNDAHGSMRNVAVEDLHEKADLISGFPKQNAMMSGIDRSFDAALLVGYHAKAHSYGVMAHTFNGRVFADVKINGTSYGETGISAALAGFYRVPVVMVSGDNILAREVTQILPHVRVTVVKERSSAFAARLMNPKKAVARLREDAKAGVLHCKTAKALDLGRDLLVEITLKEVLQADVVQAIPGVDRVSQRQIRFSARDILEVNQLIETVSNACCVLYMGLY